MTRRNLLTLGLLAIFALPAAADPAEPVEVTYVVYSRSAPENPWFGGTRMPTEARAMAEVERLKKAGCEAFYRAEGPDGNPAPADPSGNLFRVYVRPAPASPWAQAGTFKTQAEADDRAAAARKMGYEVFVR